MIQWLRAYSSVLDNVATNARSDDPGAVEQFVENLPVPMSFQVDVMVEAFGTKYFAELCPNQKLESMTLFTVTHQLGPLGVAWGQSKCWSVARRNAELDRGISVPWSCAAVENAKAITGGAGRLICFFPVAQSTCLPLNLHGCFELMSSRQSIKEIERSQWNAALCEEVVPYAYRDALIYSASVVAPRSAMIYSLWPARSLKSSSCVEQAIAQTSFRLMFSTAPIVPTAATMVTAAVAMFVYPRLSPTAQAIIAQCGPTIAHATSEEEFAALDELIAALELTKLPFRCATAADFRSAVVGRLNLADAIAITGDVAIELFCRCTDDEDFRAFYDVARFADVMPLQSGLNARPLEDTQLLFAKNRTYHMFCSELSCFDKRLLASFAADDLHCYAAKVNRRLADLACRDMLPEVNAVILKVLSEQMNNPYFVRDDQNDCSSWFLILSQTDEGLKIRSDTLTSFCLTLDETEREKFGKHLRLLPGDLEPQQQQTRRAAIGGGDVCVVLLPPDHAEDTDTDVATTAQHELLSEVHDILVSLGARVVHFPILLSNTENTSIAHVVALLDDFGVTVLAERREGSASAVISALTTLIHQDPSRATILKKSHVSATLIKYFECCVNELPMHVQSKLKQLPIFPTVHGGFMSIATSQLVLTLPRSISSTVVECYCCTAASGGLILPDVTVLDMRQFDAPQLTAFLDISEMTLLQGHALVLHVLPSPYTAPLPVPQNSSRVRRAGKDEGGEENPWTAFVRLLKESNDRADVPQLVAQCIDAAKSLPFLVSCARGQLKIAPRQCVQLENEKKRALLIHVERQLEESNPALGTDFPVVPNLDFLSNGNGLVSTFCTEFGVCDRLSKNGLMALTRAFSGHSPHNPLLVVDQCWTLLKSFDDFSTSEWTTEEIEELAKLRFVPVVPDENIVAAKPISMQRSTTDKTSFQLVTPRCASFKSSFDICPTGTRRPLQSGIHTLHSLMHLAQMFRWNDPPSVREVLDFTNSCTADSKWSSSVSVALEHLESRVAHDSASAESQLIKGSFKGFYVPFDKCFYELSRLARDEVPLSTPFLKSVSKLSVPLHQLQKLVDLLDVPQAFPLKVVATAIREFITSKTGAATTASLCSLDERDRALLIRTLKYVTEKHHAEVAEFASQHGILVPTTTGWVAASCDVQYVTSVTNPPAEDKADDEEKVVSPSAKSLDPIILHADVPIPVARALGIRHASSRMMECLLSVNSLRTCLRRADIAKIQQQLLSTTENPLHVIIMEMLKNADDAGATTFSVYLDQRKFSEQPEGLLGPNMTKLQGPALIFHNEKIFSSVDFDSLCEGSCSTRKRNDNTVIGFSGEGFNSVYNLTDCPMIVSDQQTVFLNPAADCVQGTTAELPGLGITHTNHPILARAFPAQFEPFSCEPFKVNFSKRYPGTLIRLPIRQVASETSVHSSTWTVSSIRESLKLFSADMSRCLLFLNSVTKIEVFDIHSNSSVNPMARTRISNEEQVAPFRTSVLKSLRDDVAGFHHTVLSVQDMMQRNKQSNWIVGIVVARSAKNEPSITHKQARYGGCAFCLKDNIHFGKNGDPHSLFRFCPAAQLHSSSVAFSSVPLKTSLNLPFDINGSFELAKDRRNLNASGDGSWNATILTSLIPFAIARTLNECTEKFYIDDLDYFAVWPSVTIGPEPVKALVNAMTRAFYKLLSEKAKDSCKVWLSEQGPAVATSSATFHTSSSSRLVSLSTVRTVLGDIRRVCSVPDKQFQLFVQGSSTDPTAALNIVSPEMLLNSLRERAHVCTLQKMPLADLQLGQESTDSSSSSLDMAEVRKTLIEVVKYSVAHPREVLSAAFYDAPIVLLSGGEHAGIVRSDPTCVFFAPDCTETITALCPHLLELVVAKEFIEAIGMDSKTWSKLSILALGPDVVGRLLQISRPPACVAPTVPSNGEGSASDPVPWSGDYTSNVGCWLKSAWIAIARVHLPFAQTNPSTFACGQDSKSLLLLPCIYHGEPVLRRWCDSNKVVWKSRQRRRDHENAFRVLDCVTLDPVFPQYEFVRSVCRLTQIRAESLAVIAMDAEESGVIGKLDSGQRHVVLEGLMSMGTKDVIVKVIRSLRLFEKCDGGNWKFSKWSDNGFAAPQLPAEQLPITVACDGLYRKPTPAYRLAAPKCKSCHLLSSSKTTLFLRLRKRMVR